MSDNLFCGYQPLDLFFTKDPLEKSQRVQEVVDANPKSILLSTQVLGESYHVLTRKKLFTQQETQVFVLRLTDSFPTVAVDRDCQSEVKSQKNQARRRAEVTGSPK